MTDPEAWGRALGPVGLCLAFALLVVLGALGAGTVALVGIPRWRIPGLAWALSGVWRELHGLRGDLRAYQRGEALPDLDPLEDSVPPPPVPRGAKPVRTEHQPAPPSHRPGRATIPSRPR